MGIASHVANVIIREHAWKPLYGDVVLLGRQTMFFEPAHAIGMVREAGLNVPDINFSPDRETRQGEEKFISDRDFFRLLGIPKIKALDVSAYEGADIVHDLSVPIPPSLESSADFILDGSTLDNVFDIATVLRNIVRMLRPGGRLVSVNMASNHRNPYIIPTPHLLLDYFVMNGFSDCKVYLFVHGDTGLNVFTPNLDRISRDQGQPQNFVSPYTTGLVIFAEKGASSTFDQSPVQHQYRVNWDLYEANLEHIKLSGRPELAQSEVPPYLSYPDYRFVSGKDAEPRSDAPALGFVSETNTRDLIKEVGRRVRSRVISR